MEWSYAVVTVKTPEVASLQNSLRMMGADGWELVTSVTTVKTWVNLSGNDLVFIFKKAGAGHWPPDSVPGVQRRPAWDVS